MSEHMKRYFTQEEDFLEDFSMLVGAVLKVLNDEWQPNWHCDEDVRRSQSFFLKTGELFDLVFDSAAVYHDKNNFSSAQIVLKSSKRVVTIHVRQVGKEYIAEKTVDRPSCQFP